ncbi:S-layer homology domain-containing protein [Paenibacillus xylanexedens]|uniref:S-layer homology domain-containing protein n=1 Tax=Paenibacillus xylanexedens TaxID=528191 RepID=UPI00119D5069|nr:S-layer homology domain-containing protein [Paenibacillus xylanexedens]
MPAQYPFGTANDRYKKRLFVEVGLGFQEVRGKIIQPYTPPVPQPSIKEVKIINAPSHFHQMGISSYKSKLTLLFEHKEQYDEYVSMCGWTHKFYDERGAMYLGSLESISTEFVWLRNALNSNQDRNRGYRVEVELLLIKKDTYDRKSQVTYQDIDDHWAKNDIQEMADAGLISVISSDGTPVLYFRPKGFITRAEFISFLNRTRRLIERMLRE